MINFSHLWSLINSSKKIHMLGICGIGVSALAMLYSSRNLNVQGSDKEKNYITEILEKYGINVFIPHNDSNIDNDTELVIVSSAIKEDNIELIKAKNNNIKIISRAEALAAIKTTFINTISITGTHGKTTTTAMVASVLSIFNPTVVNGGIMNSTNCNLINGSNKLLILESDESDGSFLILKGNINIITNIEEEHIDYYGNTENFIKTFIDFIISLINDRYHLIVFGDDKYFIKIQSLLEEKRINKNSFEKIITYGFNDYNDVIIKKYSTSNKGIFFELSINNNLLSEFDLSKENKINDIIKLNNSNFFIPCYGLHNIENATAAIIAGSLSGLETNEIFNGLSRFSGVKRRFTFLGHLYNMTSKNISIFEDYAHHPTEIKSVVEITDTWKKYHNQGMGRIILIIQPHRYSRFSQCYEKFIECIISLNTVDIIFIMPIFEAGENPYEYFINNNRINNKKASILLVNEILEKKLRKNVFFLEEKKFLINIEKVIEPNDIIVCTGAGDINKYAKLLIKK
ncbi:UDP-N-acetylmuramate--L-alanine ligase [Lyticum sinuosum]|uniref:UDP-N-acetylmuramate--L-alanine ligase n=1 Tax=Lyticum sinuosum TaxID=1332059 RepID=A0AAE4VJJ8_9RICK|nr:UDP-N-acetylmuramate--L-alanine ligase [Lyticum sinuosum]MDZ5761200.1 UDP-N-acetylmuramate--L-alanine ligase [Lyticum sinuosum]